MKLLLISPLPPPSGGIATWTSIFVDEIGKFNIDVNVVNTSFIGNRKLKNIDGRNFFEEVRRTIKIIADLKKKLKNDTYDIVHLNTSCSKFGVLRDYFIATIAKKHAKLIVHFHCNIEDQTTNNISKMFVKKIAKKASANFVLNSKSNEFLFSNGVNKISIIPNFISEDWIYDETKLINKFIKDVVFVGHVELNKGIKEIFEVAKKFKNINFHLIGKIPNYIEDFSISNNVLLHGVKSHKEVKEIMINSDVFLFPTYTEGFSLSLLEAMAMGLPIITTQVGANKDMLENSGALFIDKSNIEQIEENINLIQDSSLRRSMSIWNIQKVRRNYTCKTVIQMIVNIYNQV